MKKDYKDKLKRGREAEDVCPYISSTQAGGKGEVADPYSSGKRTLTQGPSFSQSTPLLT